MAKVTITLSDFGDDGVHGRIVIESDEKEQTVAEKVGILMMRSFNQGTIPGLPEDALVNHQIH